MDVETKRSVLLFQFGIGFFGRCRRSVVMAEERLELGELGSLARLKWVMLTKLWYVESSKSQSWRD